MLAVYSMGQMHAGIPPPAPQVGLAQIGKDLGRFYKTFDVCALSREHRRSTSFGFYIRTAAICLLSGLVKPLSRPGLTHDRWLSVRSQLNHTDFQIFLIDRIARVFKVAPRVFTIPVPVLEAFDKIS